MSVILSFVYINEYKNIKEQGFNTEGEYFFSFDPETRVLSYNRNERFIPDYYSLQKDSRSKVKNVTAIIGQNGSGKSTFLEFVGQLFRSWDNFSPATSLDKDLVVLRNGLNLGIYFDEAIYQWSLGEDNGSVQLRLNDAQKIETTDENYRTRGTNNQEIKGSLLPFYYSTSMYDRFSELDIKEWDMTNISSSYFYYSTNMPVSYDRNRQSNIKRITHPSNFKYEDAIRQLSFLNENGDGKLVPLRFKLYDYFGISVRQTFAHSQNFKKIFLEIYRKYPPTNDIEFLKLQLFTSVILGFIYPPKNSTPRGVEPDKNYYNEFSEELKKDQQLLELIITFLQNHPFKNAREIVEFMGRSMEMYNYRIENKIELIKYIENNFVSENFKNSGDNALINFKRFRDNNIFFNPFTYQFKLAEGLKFCELYLNQLEDLTPDFMEIKWGDLSSGEIGFLNLFSRFYFGFSNFKGALKSEGGDLSNYKKTVFIMIDEGEAFFHPQWQKEYLKILINYFENLFEGLSVQVLIASNSPFISSDIPSYNIVFLERGENGECIISPNEDHTETLATNIHLLFKDAFYLKDGFMGEFAKEKLQEVIDLLHLEKKKFSDLSQEDRNRILNLILNIGEPVLKDKLMEMYNSQADNSND